MSIDTIDWFCQNCTRSGLSEVTRGQAGRRVALTNIMQRHKLISPACPETNIIFTDSSGVQRRLRDGVEVREPVLV